ncbi:MAG: CCA tRNA nucleotidyltransferase [Proteobacteria bacterium]|nr:CCA tRNA nucleotidyltransferase [Pseudomonadota bacterium]
MKPVLTLSPQSFIQDAGLLAVMEALGPGQALMVGGAVRAAILGEAAGDIDIATIHTPEIVTARLEAAGIKVVPTGLEHGTVTAVANSKGYEITTLRRDVETDGRRAVVAYTTDWAEDAQRRDFTMNTLLMDLDGHVFDPTGQGVQDLKAGCVRFVGDAVTRIAEDALRILRFFRFHARYGKGAPDAAGLKACGAAASNIKNLSRERITHEIERMLPLPQASGAIAAMQSVGIMPDFFQSGFNQKVYDGLRDFVVTQAFEAVFPTLFAYSVWENEADKIDAKISKYIVFSKQKHLKLKNCIEFIHEHSESIKYNLYTYGKDTTLAGGILLHVINGESFNLKASEVLLESVRTTPVPQFSLKASDVMRECRIGQGKELGDILKKVEAWWLENDTLPDHNACIEYVKSMR